MVSLKRGKKPLFKEYPKNYANGISNNSDGVDR